MNVKDYEAELTAQAVTDAIGWGLTPREAGEYAAIYMRGPHARALILSHRIQAAIYAAQSAPCRLRRTVVNAAKVVAWRVLG